MRWKRSTAGTISVSIDSPNDRRHVRVVVEDNGRGIPAQIVNKIFIPFFTTKTHGTGLGLSLVQKIVLAHNGQHRNPEQGPQGHPVHRHFADQPGID
jgi:signal transduction histidine kinase